LVQIAKLAVDLFLNTVDFVTGAEKAGRSYRSFQKQVEKGSKVVAGAVGTAAAALTALTVRQMHVIDATGKLSRALGVNVTDFQAIALVADEAGVEMENLGNLMLKAQKNIEAASNAKNDPFKKIGLSAKELIALRPDEQFDRIATALSGIENPTQRNALALQYFGKQGKDVINMLEDYSAKAEEARQFNDKFNISLTDIDVRMVEEANDTFGRLGKVVGGFGNTIAIEVSPLVTYLSQQLLDAGIDGEDFGKAVQVGMDVAAGAIDIVRHGVLGTRMAIALAMNEIYHLVAQGAPILYELGQKTANLYNATVGKLTGTKREAEDGLLEIAYSAKLLEEQSKSTIATIGAGIVDFEPTYKKIERIQEEARKRAEKASKGGAVGDPSSLIDTSANADEIQRVIEALAGESAQLDNQIRLYGQKESAVDRANKMLEIEQKLAEKGITLSAAQREAINGYLDDIERKSDSLTFMAEKTRIVDNATDELLDTVADGKATWDDLRSVALKALQDIVKAVIKANETQLTIGSTGGSSGGFLSSILGSLGNAIFGGSSHVSAGGLPLPPPSKPSHATGLDYVARDMTARLHKGEAVLDAEDANSWRNGDTGEGGIYVETIDARGAGPGVENAIRNVINDMNALRRQVPAIALSTVKEANKRDPRLLGA